MKKIIYQSPVHNKTCTIQNQSSSIIHKETEQSLDCPNCDKKCAKLQYYPCCLQPICKNCYEGFHLLQCKKKSCFGSSVTSKKNSNKDNQSMGNSRKKTGYSNASINSPFVNKKDWNENNNNSNKSARSNGCQGQKNTQNKMMNLKKDNLTCSRCEESCNQIYIMCLNCVNKVYCKQCYSKVHSTGKFANHRHKQVKNYQNNAQILICAQHKKARQIISETMQLVCQDCVSQYKIRKLKTISNKENSEQPIARIQLLVSEIQQKNVLHQNKWKQLRQKINEEFQKITDMIQQKYKHCLNVLQKVVHSEKNILTDALFLCSSAKKQSKISNYKFTQDNQRVYNARLHILCEELTKKKKVIQSAEYFTHKVGEIQLEKLENLLKNYCIQKYKIKQDDKCQRESSLRKSVSRPKNNNLSSSRKSFESSNKLNDSRVSMKSVAKQLPQNNSSGKKSLQNANRNRLFSNIQQIQPMQLQFDGKDVSNKSRISFLPSKTENDSKNLQDISDANSISSTLYTRPNKRKSDYYDLRQRMRKPSVVSNRFNKK